MAIDTPDPELQAAYRKSPSPRLDWPGMLSLARFLVRRIPDMKPPQGVAVEDRSNGDFSLRIYTPEGERSGAAVLWIHGGGMVMGTVAMNDYECCEWVQALDAVVVSVEYRVAPEHPFPAPLDDCFAAWHWLQAEAAGLGVDPGRIVIGGQSAGGGLAASLAQRLRDAGGVQPAGQALYCPMLDDRTAARTELDGLKHKLWNNHSNRRGWSLYLGCDPGAADVPEYASPARREDLSGLPPAWIGVGDADLFYEEAARYGERLLAAGTACDMHVTEDGFHGFEGMIREAAVTRALTESNLAFCRRVLGIEGPGGSS